MKRFFVTKTAIVLAVVLILGLAGCAVEPAKMLKKRMDDLERATNYDWEMEYTVTGSNAAIEALAREANMGKGHDATKDCSFTGKVRDLNGPNEAVQSASDSTEIVIDQEAAYLPMRLVGMPEGDKWLIIDRTEYAETARSERDTMESAVNPVQQDILAGREINLVQDDKEGEVYKIVYPTENKDITVTQTVRCANPIYELTHVVKNNAATITIRSTFDISAKDDIVPPKGNRISDIAEMFEPLPMVS